MPSQDGVVECLARVAHKIRKGEAKKPGERRYDILALLQAGVLTREEIEELEAGGVHLASVQVLRGIGNPVAFDTKSGQRMISSLDTGDPSMTVPVARVRETVSGIVERIARGDANETLLNADDAVSVVITSDLIAVSIPADCLEETRTRIKSIMAAFGVTLLKEEVGPAGCIYCTYARSGNNQFLPSICEQVFAEGAQLPPHAAVQIWLA